MQWGQKGTLKGTVLRGSKKGYVVVAFDDGEEWNVSSTILTTIGGGSVVPAVTTPKMKVARQASAPSRFGYSLVAFFSLAVVALIAVALSRK
jgi:hypothetical protein